MQWNYSIEDLNESAIKCWEVAANFKILAFHGPVGAGKTTFIHAMCDVKSVNDVVGSPTFSIINEYLFYVKGNKKKIYHIDLYRLRDEDEAVNAGIEDCLNNEHICLIEWPEKIARLLPDDTLHIFLEVVDSNTRRLIIEDK